MKEQIALIADIHGNVPALEAVLVDIGERGIDRVFCLGDVVGKGPQSALALDMAAERCERMVLGNWEEAVVDGWIRSAPYYQKALGAERLALLGALPRGIFFSMSGRKVKLYHGRTTIKSVVFSNSPKEDVLAALDALDEPSDVVGFADCHQPFCRMCEARMLFNVGSVGNPCDGVPMASYAILRGDMEGKELSPLSVEFVRLPYDNARSAAIARTTPDLPHVEMYIQEVETGRFSRGPAVY